MHTHKGTFTVHVDQQAQSFPVAISITVGTDSLTLFLSKNDADNLSSFLSVTNTPRRNLPFAVLPTFMISSASSVHDVKWLSFDEVDIMQLPPCGSNNNTKHFKIETGLANCLSEEIAAKLGSPNMNSINPVVYGLAHPVPPIPTNVFVTRFNVSIRNDKNFPILINIFGDKVTLDMALTKADAEVLAKFLQHNPPFIIAMYGQAGESNEFTWIIPGKVRIEVYYKLAAMDTLVISDDIAARLATELLLTIQGLNVSTTMRKMPIPMDFVPNTKENLAPPDFEKEMCKRTDKELRRVLGF